MNVTLRERLEEGGIGDRVFLYNRREKYLSRHFPSPYIQPNTLYQAKAIVVCEPQSLYVLARHNSRSWKNPELPRNEVWFYLALSNTEMPGIPRATDFCQAWYLSLLL